MYILIAVAIILFLIAVVKLLSKPSSDNNSTDDTNDANDANDANEYKFMADNFYEPTEDIDDYEEDMPEGIGCETIYDGEYFILFYQEDDNFNVIFKFIFREINDECINMVKQTFAYLVDHTMEERLLKYHEQFKEKESFIYNEIEEKYLQQEGNLDKNLVIVQKNDGELVLTLEGSNSEYFDLHKGVIEQRKEV